MSTLSRSAVVLWCFGLAGLLAWAEQPNKQSGGSAPDANAGKPIEQPAPKPISKQTTAGIAYLVAHQHADGGWGQGGGWRSGGKNGGRVEGKDVADPSDVGDTAMALLVLLRAGNTPEQGAYAVQFAKGLDFLYQHVESADKDSLYVTDVRDTQLQTKIGPYVDTFAVTWLMSELKGGLASPPSRLLAALDKTIAKIERNQKDDGTFGGNRAWASVLSQGLCAVALNTAAHNGVKVAERTLQRDFRLATNGVDVKTGSFDMAAASPKAASGFGGAMGATSVPTLGRPTVVTGGTTVAISGGTMSVAAAPSATSNAGIELYQLSVQSAQLNSNVAAAAPERKKANEALSSTNSTDAEKHAARAKLRELDERQQYAAAATKAVNHKLGDRRFTAGFGNNGGEEFLSYMNISLSLRVKGGPEWHKWDRQVTDNLVRVQNSDGSWSGDHCITGRTFCTAAALLTMMADRAPLGSQTIAAVRAK